MKILVACEESQAVCKEFRAIGENYKIITSGSITSKTESDNFGGTKLIQYKFEPITLETIDDMGKSIKASDKRKNSVKMRNWLFKHYANEGYTEDFDRVYDQFTTEVLAMTPVLLREAIKKLNQ